MTLWQLTFTAKVLWRLSTLVRIVALLIKRRADADASRSLGVFAVKTLRFSGRNLSVLKSLVKRCIFFSAVNFHQRRDFIHPILPVDSLLNDEKIFLPCGHLWGPWSLIFVIGRSLMRRKLDKDDQTFMVWLITWPIMLKADKAWMEDDTNPQ